MYLANPLHLVLINSWVIINYFYFSSFVEWYVCVLFSFYQTEDNPEQQEDVTSGKKKRRKKKKNAKSEDVAAESEGPARYQEPPKIEVI